MGSDLGYGPRLSGREYEKKIVELHSGMPPSPGREEEARVRRRELDLAVDHRLGKDFPKEKRDALWEIQQRVEKKRMHLVFRWLFHFISYKPLYKKANRLAGFLVDEYAKVLTKDEIVAFFDLKENEEPSLPMDF